MAFPERTTGPAVTGGEPIPSQAGPGIGDLAGLQLPFTPGPPRDEADRAQRAQGWEAFFRAPQIQAALMQFASQVTSQRQPGQSSLNQFIQSVQGGAQAAGGVQTAIEAKEAAARAESREDRVIGQDDRRIGVSEEEQRRLERGSIRTDATTRRGQEATERIEGEKANVKREETAAQVETRAALAELNRANAAVARASPGAAAAELENKVRVAEIQAQATVEAAVARRKGGKLPETRDEFVLLAAPEIMAAHNADADPEFGVPLMTTEEALASANRFADGSAKYREQKTTAESAQAAKEWDQLSFAEADSLISDPEKLRQIAGILGMTTAEVFASVQAKKQQSAVTGDIGAPER
jgi:hypothetical protein